MKTSAVEDFVIEPERYELQGEWQRGFRSTGGAFSRSSAVVWLFCCWSTPRRLRNRVNARALAVVADAVRPDRWN
jgi:hypothetical protein